MTQDPIIRPGGPGSILHHRNHRRMLLQADKLLRSFAPFVRELGDLAVSIGTDHENPAWLKAGSALLEAAELIHAAGQGTKPRR
jgi:hypothetical protein